MLDTLAFAGANDCVYLLAFLLATAPLERPLSPMDASDLERAAQLLRQHVAYLQVTRAVEEEQPLMKGDVDGWGLVTGPRELTCQAFLVEGATEIRVQGPRGVTTATVRDIDVPRRVAHLVLAEPTPSLGLAPATPSPPEERETGMDVFALVSTQPRSGVVAGALTHIGKEPWLEGHLRSSLQLTRGMPVFDSRLRWLGISRTVAWDRDRGMLIPPELTETATVAPLAPRPPAAEPERPWWAP